MGDERRDNHREKREKKREKPEENKERKSSKPYLWKKLKTAEAKEARGQAKSLTSPHPH